MHSIWLIARREYVERVRTRGFLITTILIPLIMGGFLFGSLFLSPHQAERHVVIVSPDVDLATSLQADLQAQPTDSSRQPRITADVMEPAPDTRSLLEEQMDSGDVDGYLWIQSIGSGQFSYSWVPHSAADRSTRAAVAASLARVLAQRGLTPPPQLQSTSRPYAHSPDRASVMVSIGVLFFLMYFAIMLYGMNVARSVIEEKTSRIFEVLLSTVRPEEMMAGKILGVGAVGLTQVGIWLGAILLASVSSATGITIDGQTLRPTLSGPQFAYFFLFFLLGYLFYSSIAAALGAMTNSEQELQQMNIFLMLPLIFCFIALGAMLTTPDTPAARILALLPPFTPLLMYMRLALGHPAAWEVGLSIALLTASTAAVIWVTSRIYRVGVLMYGKRPSVSEVFRWLRYS